MKIHNIIPLIIFILAIQISTSFAMQNMAIKTVKMGISSLCSGFELMCIFNPLTNAYRHHQAIVAKKTKKYHSNASEKIINFVEQIKQERNIKQNIHVIIKENGHRSYNMSSNKNSLNIPPLVSQELENLLEKKERTSEEQLTLNEHIGAIHHEFTHLKNDDSTYNHIYESVIGTIGSAIIIETINQSLIKRIPFLNNNFIAHNIFKISRSVARVEIARYIINSNLYSKYAELRADAGIPNKKELLEAQIKYYKQEHEAILDVIDDVKSSTWQEIMNRPEQHRQMLNNPQVLAMKIFPKNWFNNSLITNLICYPRTTHPCGLQRVQRFEDRMAKL